MNTLEQKYFESLHNDRAESARTFEKPSMRKTWRSIVEKYSDQAHFIYELIQNADDAEATSARFTLEPGRLIFAHNGNRHFSISNPETEDIDFNEGRLGDINAITGISFSNKTSQENKIGKFGVGFKAVFQHTASPLIYDTNFRFRIDKYIVPSELDEDFPGRKPEETLFVLPFNHEDRTAEQSYADIEKKLKDLKYPLLFLTNLTDITFEIGDLIGLYGKSTLEKHILDNGTVAEKLCLMRNDGNEIISEYIWLFSRYFYGLKYSVGFFIDEEGSLIPVNEPAFCYFPTKETTGLKFIVHAPFLLTDSREGIRTGIAHNNQLISLLAKLAGAALLHLRDFGLSSSKRIVADNILSIIPMDENSFCKIDDTSRISFLPFYHEIKNVFLTQKILPTRNGYASAKNAYWAYHSYLTELFDDEQLADITGNPNAKWVFVSLGRDGVQKSGNRVWLSYLDAITNTALDVDHLLSGRYTDFYSRKKDIQGITAAFIEKQNVEWLHRFYKWLNESEQRTEKAKLIPIFLDQCSKATAAYQSDDTGVHLKLFLPGPESAGYRTVREDLLQNQETQKFIKRIGISYPSLRDQIYNVIIPQYGEENATPDTDAHFKVFFKYYQQFPEDVESFLEELKNLDFLTCFMKNDETHYLGRGEELYFPNPDLLDYFEAKPTTLFIAYDKYKSLIGTKNEKMLKSFLIELGVSETVRVYDREITRMEVYSRKDIPMPYST